MAQTRYIVVLCIMLLAIPQMVLASKTHVVRKSESLHSIARKYHVSVEELKSVNNLSGTHLNKGARVIIPSHPDAQPAKHKIAAKQKSYKVAKGDTIPKIAKKTGLKIADIRRFNGLKGNRVKPGQVLALMDAASGAEETPHASVAVNRLQLVNRDLLNEQEFSDTLAELTDISSERPVDLAKSLQENSAGANKIKKTAYSFLGARYRFGGNSRTALDCSSFTQQVFREQKVSLPRTAREQFYVGNEVVRGDLQKGDLVFFQTYARFPSHVGIYLGNRKMIHASSRDRRVVISTMDTPYYTSRYLGARRIGKDVPDAINFDDLLQGIEEEREGDVFSNDMLGVTSSMNN
ncbi:MAG: C40 family peptidase [Desulfuromonadales bacterium]|nr:C40 family peptidase [Desulfuromonadales bacterium]